MSRSTALVLASGTGAHAWWNSSPEPASLQRNYDDDSKENNMEDSFSARELWGPGWLSARAPASAAVNENDARYDDLDNANEGLEARELGKIVRKRKPSFPRKKVAREEKNLSGYDIPLTRVTRSFGKSTKSRMPNISIQQVAVRGLLLSEIRERLVKSGMGEEEALNLCIRMRKDYGHIGRVVIDTPKKYRSLEEDALDEDEVMNEEMELRELIHQKERLDSKKRVVFFTEDEAKAFLGRYILNNTKLASVCAPSSQRRFIKCNPRTGVPYKSRYGVPYKSSRYSKAPVKATLPSYKSRYSNASAKAVAKKPAKFPAKEVAPKKTITKRELEGEDVLEEEQKRELEEQEEPEA